jgi:hypothetical protein
MKDLQNHPEIEDLVNDMMHPAVQFIGKVSETFEVDPYEIGALLKEIVGALATREPHLTQEESIKLHGFLVYEGLPPRLFMVVDENEQGRYLLDYAGQGQTASEIVLHDVSRKKHRAKRLFKNKRNPDRRKKH